MAGETERLTLGALDFLGLADEKKVARVDLAEAGRKGVVWVCELATERQMQIFSPKSGKRRTTRQGDIEVDLKDLPMDAASRLMEECLVTDKEGGALLERLWDEAEATAEDGKVDHILVAAEELVYMKLLWQQKLGGLKLMREKLGEMPNAVTSLISGVVSRISGMTDDLDKDAIEEKKDAS